MKKKKRPRLNKRDLTGQARIKFRAFLPALKLRQAGGYAFVAFGLFVGVLGFGECA
ncbi:hypothetical protein J7J13_02625 [bacterium]|nr:hypothetical protein [bacterium]